MNMIVCTCDTCGKVVENWSTLNINLRADGWKREICSDCYNTIRQKTDDFVNSITVTNKNDE